MRKTIAILPGDGIGPEIIEQAIKVLKIVGTKFNHEFVFEYGLIGAIAIDKTGNPLPNETLKLCKSTDAILFGAIGDPKYDNDPSAKIRPEQGLLKLRKSLDLYVNVRPIRVFEKLKSKSPLKGEILEGVDFVVVRELIGGIYFGKRGRRKNGTVAYDTSTYSKAEIERVAKFAFELVLTRKKHITVVDKANVLETSRLWRETIQEQSKQYNNVTIEFMFVDNAAMQIIKKPSSFDVILTENMFGDILTDEASVITGSIGMLPSASIGAKTSLYEPIHGSYPKAKGLNTANPIGTILSAAMMLEYSFGLIKEAKSIENAVEKAINLGFGTKDIVSNNPLGTSELGTKIASLI
ncbi:MAG: 3-isopropylmalate dehydrogenase [Candidatus Levyibacteriota bacterium]|nr:MAG: 3-isopropylmalate dehydrogenase [Candidatus Levybacteria bacterium]